MALEPGTHAQSRSHDLTVAKLDLLQHSVNVVSSGYVSALVLGAATRSSYRDEVREMISEDPEFFRRLITDDTR